MSDACFDVKEQLSFVASARSQRAVCTQNSIGSPRGSSAGSPRSLSLIPSANSQVCDPPFRFSILRDIPLSSSNTGSRLHPTILSGFPGVPLLGPRGAFAPITSTHSSLLLSFSFFHKDIVLFM